MSEENQLWVAHGKEPISLLPSFQSVPVLEEDTLALLLDLLNPLDGLDRCCHKVTVIPDRNVTALLEL